MENQPEAFPLPEPGLGPRRSGCLKWTCGGCLGVVLLGIALAAVLWHYFNRWGEGESAWERMAPSTVWAVEAYDARQLAENALQDKTLAGLFRIVASRFNREIADAFGPGYSESGTEWDLIDMYERFGFLHTVALPNTILAATTANGDFYLLVKLPVWFRTAIPENEQGTVQYWQHSLYLSYIDGWAALSTSEYVLHEILDNWNASPQPLGPAAKVSRPYIFMAGKRMDAQAEALPEAAPARGGLPMALGDPFAGNAGGASSPEGMAVRLMVLPDAGNWVVAGGMRCGASGDAVSRFLNRPFDTARSFPPLSPPRSDIYDLRAAGRMAPDVYDAFCREVFRRLDQAPVSDAVQGLSAALAATLGRGNGKVLFFAEKPVKPDEDFAPLPVMTFGWEMVEGTDARDAADMVDRAVAGMAARATDSDSSILRAVGESIVVTRLNDAEGVGGTVALPPVMANAANPSWFFLTRSIPASGWLSSDPRGLEEVEKLQFPSGEGEGGGQGVQVAADWDLSEEFRLSLLEVFRDRMRMLPDDVLSDRGTVIKIGEYMNEFFSHYPRGGLELLEEEGIWDWRITIPKG